jgi:uncharacterized iron-regulated membrane protein
VTFLIVILALVLVGLVVFVVSAPLRHATPLNDGAEASHAAQLGTNPLAPPMHAQEELETALETAREAKYREIRDAELDYRTGKLSREDYEAIDADLRAEALELLNKLERLRPKGA